MGWIYVFVASALEILGVVGLKLFSRRKSLFNLALFSGGFALSYLFLYFSLAYLDMSIAYAAWMGLGTAGAVIINMVFFWREPENVTDCRRRFNCYRRCRSENGFLTEFIKNSPFESENGECVSGTGWSAAFCLLLQQFGYIQCCTVFYFDHFMIFYCR